LPDDLLALVADFRTHLILLRTLRGVQPHPGVAYSPRG